MYIENNVGDKMPLGIVKQVDVSLPYFIQIYCLLYQNISIRIKITEIDRLR